MSQSNPAPAMGYLDTAPFWDGIRERRLVLQFCTDSGRFQHPPRPVSIFTGSRRIEWRETDGAGTIHATSVLRASTGRGTDSRDHCYASVDLDAGVRLLGRLLDCPPGTARVGARVVLAWDTLPDGRGYPAFRLESVESKSVESGSVESKSVQSKSAKS